MKTRPANSEIVTDSTALIVVSDLHVNSTVGLCPPDMELPDGGAYQPNKFQQWLWGNWLHFCKWTARFPNRAVLLNGDVVQGIHTRRDAQIITTSKTLMRRAAIQVVEPLLDGAGEIFFNIGTEFHDDLGGDDIEEIAKNFDVKPDGETGRYARWVLWLSIQGKLIHATHHISVAGVYPTTPPARAWKLAKELHVDGGLPLPDVMIRSHVHRFGIYPDSNGRILYTTPAWQLKNAYIWKRNPLAIPSIGGMALWVEDGEIKCLTQRYPVPFSSPTALILRSMKSSPCSTPQRKPKSAATRRAK